MSTKRLWLVAALTALSLRGAAAPAPRSVETEDFIILKAGPVAASDGQYRKNKELLRAVEESVTTSGGTVISTYLRVFVGLHVKLPAQLANTLRNDPRIAAIVPNGTACLVANPTATPVSWGQDRVDQRDLPLDNGFNIPYKGDNVHAYIVDTGLRGSHQEFLGHVGDGYSALPDDSTTTDCNGHGTHVAGTVMGATVGLAVNTMVHPVRVFGCQGSTTWDIILKALEWVINNKKTPAVLNMSLGGGANAAIDTATRNTVNAGVTVVVAAGNSNADACNSSPAREPSAITVAASVNNDARASFSNWGACIDIFAPGQAITSSWNSADNAYASLSGTSMASPHVCGAAALVAGVRPGATPAEVATTLVNAATVGKITDPQNSVNKLLYVKQFSAAPIVDAGPDVIKRFPSSVELVGKARDTDGYIVEAQWEQLAGPAVDLGANDFDWEDRLILDGLAVGEYAFRFSATDDTGLVGSDDVKVTITASNMTPTADAGADQRINLGTTATVDGSKSADLDGSIVRYLWEKVSGPAGGTIVAPGSAITAINDLTAGNHVFRLTVWDNENASASDDIQINVNQPPVADAGPDQQITLPTNSVTLNGSGSDDSTALRFAWIQVSGPAAATIRSPAAASTVVDGLVKGIYVFRLTVTDNMNASGSDDVLVTVIDTNQAPVVTVSPDKIITLPENSTIIAGTCEDSDGSCVKIKWRYEANFAASKLVLRQLKSNLMVSGLTAGVYRFTVVGTDNSGAESRATMTLTVNSATPLTAETL